MKTCTKCGIQKPETEFSISKGRLRNDCKKCKVENTRRWKSLNPCRNEKHIRAFWKKRVSNLHPNYIEKFLIRDYGFDKGEIKNNPIIVEIKQLIIKTKRL